jgi:hypothetical protein
VRTRRSTPSGDHPFQFDAKAGAAANASRLAHGSVKLNRQVNHLTFRIN